ncbi:hypothetical protein K456DRAFT_51705 [Colletotrichum gloeosporioides 23]|nr:hypothetical protein K456DRAFT_51705 [Colletotrichum gloeosporioides 23]
MTNTSETLPAHPEPTVINDASGTLPAHPEPPVITEPTETLPAHPEPPVINEAMLPPKPQFVREIERITRVSLPPNPPPYSHAISTAPPSSCNIPAPPNNTYFAQICRRERENALPVYEFDKERPRTMDSQRSFYARSFRQELAVEARNRRRKFDCIAAVVVALILMGCAGTLAAVLVSTREK